MSEHVSDGSQEDELYQESMRELKSPKPMTMGSATLSTLTLLFIGAMFLQLRSVTGVLLLTATVLLHEAGHAMGMRAFRFTNVQMFFIPFFGAAVSGRERGAATWKEAVVSLLGPLPGLILGLVLLSGEAAQPFPTKLMFDIAAPLLWINAFNLLPLGFLDGGRFLDRVLFSRNRVLGVVFQCLGNALLGYLAWIGGMLVLGVFVLFNLLAIPAHWRVLTAAARLRKQLPTLDPDPERLDEPDSRIVFEAARTVRVSWKPSQIAQTMDSILAATKRAPGMGATMGLIGVYGLGVVVSMFGIGLLSVHLGPVEWRTFAGPQWRAEFPRRPQEYPAGEQWHAIVDGVERFTIEARRGTDDDEWMKVRAQQLAKVARMEVGPGRPVDVGGHPGMDFEMSAPRRVMRARMVAFGSRRYVVTSSAPRWGENQSRFIASFAPRDSSTRP